MPPLTVGGLDQAPKLSDIAHRCVVDIVDRHEHASSGTATQRDLCQGVVDARGPAVIGFGFWRTTWTSAPAMWPPKLTLNCRNHRGGGQGARVVDGKLGQLVGEGHAERSVALSLHSQCGPASFLGLTDSAVQQDRFAHTTLTKEDDWLVAPAGLRLCKLLVEHTVHNFSPSEQRGLLSRPRAVRVHGYLRILRGPGV